MPTRPCPVPPSTRALGPAELDALVTALVDASAGAPPAVVRARRGPDLTDLGIARVPAGLDPVDALVGVVVPAAWHAGGLVTPVTATLPDGTRRPGVAAVVVGRDGHVASQVGGAGIPPVDEAPEGTVVDLLRRSLGLATPPPATAPSTFWTTLWLDGVVAGALQDGGPAPADARRAGAPAGIVPSPVGATAVTAELVDALSAVPALDDPAGWGRVRRIVAAPADGSDGPADVDPAAAEVVRRSLAPLVSPSEAAWHDDGSFARWLGRALPPVAELLEIADLACEGDLVRQLRAVTSARRSGGPPHRVGSAPTVPDRRRGRR